MDQFICGNRTYSLCEEITKGWSGDRKFRALDDDGVSVLIRIVPREQYETKLREFNLMHEAAALGIPMCIPIDIGVFDDNTVTIHRWIDGRDAEDIIPLLTDTEQYLLGEEAGSHLRALHNIPAPADQEPWESRFNRKLDRKIAMYSNCPLKYEKGEAFISYIENNRHLLKNRPQSFQHGDFHIGNMILDYSGKLYIIDFNRFDFGDPWEEFNRIVWCAQKAPFFATGMVNGYFKDNIPAEFWRLLALYISSNTLSSLPWAIPFGEAEIATMQKQAAEVLTWYDDMRNPIPTWYKGSLYIQHIDGIPCKLRAPFDFSFLSKYGRVFKVFDDQDSGNICFGCEKAGERYFIKFAGAPTEQYSGCPEEAIERLKATHPVYTALHHDTLIEFITSEEIAGGFAMIFKWADGDCMGRMYPAARKAFMALPNETKLRIFSDISRFFAYIAEQGWLAVDFYDGSILYDPKRGKTTICDIDFFRPSPSINDMGRMWGSSRFQAPEEYEHGAVLDEITNVYTLGATAFALFADSDRSLNAWPLSDALYDIAAKATNSDRVMRHSSIAEFINEWNTAL